MSRLRERRRRGSLVRRDPRVTHDETMRLSRRALATTNDEIARLIDGHGVEAVGSSAWPDQIVRPAHGSPFCLRAKSVDLGRVGMSRA